MLGFRAIALSIAAALLLLPAPVAAAPAAPGGDALAAAAARTEGPAPQSGPGADATRPDAARPGAFCLPGGCRPAEASLWNGVAFAAALLAIRWRARRRPPASL